MVNEHKQNTSCKTYFLISNPFYIYAKIIIDIKRIKDRTKEEFTQFSQNNSQNGNVLIIRIMTQSGLPVAL